MAYPTIGGRTSGFPGSITAGASVGATNNNTLPGGMISYARITTNTSGFAPGGGGAALLSGISGLDVGLTTVGTRMIKITVQAAYFILAGSGSLTVDFGVYDATGAVSLATQIVANGYSVGQNIPGATVVAYHQPPAATAQNYQAAVTVVGLSGSPTCAVGATAGTSAFRGAWIMVEDVSEAF